MANHTRLINWFQTLKSWIPPNWLLLQRQLTMSVYYADASAIQLTDPFNDAAPNLKPKAGSPALTTAGKFDKGLLTDAFFDKTTYIGALDATNDWTAGWAVWGK